MIDAEEPFDAQQVRRFAQEVYESPDGYIAYPAHLLKRMKERNILKKDITNVLLRGFMNEGPEWEMGEYRYRIETRRYRIVIVFDPPARIIVVTAMDLK